MCRASALSTVQLLWLPEASFIGPALYLMAAIGNGTVGDQCRVKRFLEGLVGGRKRPEAEVDVCFAAVCRGLLCGLLDGAWVVGHSFL